MWLQTLAELHLLKQSFAFDFSGPGFHAEALHWACRGGVELGWTSEEQAAGRFLPAVRWPARASVASRHASMEWARMQHRGEIVVLCTSKAATWLHRQHRHELP